MKSNQLINSNLEFKRINKHYKRINHVYINKRKTRKDLS